MALNEALSVLWPVGVVLVLIATFCGALGDILVKKAFERRKTKVAAADSGERSIPEPSLDSVQPNASITDVTLPQAEAADQSPQVLEGDRESTGAFCGSLQDMSAPEGALEGNTHGQRSDRWLQVKYLVSDPVWVCGMLCTAVVDPILTTVALMFAPSSIVTPFCGAHILWGCVLALALLHERMFYLDFLGAGLVIGGIVVIVIYASKAGDVRSVDDFLQCLRTPEAIVCVVVLMLLLVTCIIVACVPVRRKEEHVETGRKHLSDSPVRILLCNVDVRRLAMCGATGFLGGFTNTCAKVLTLELSRVFDDPHVLRQDWQPYFSVCLTLVFALPQLYFLNKSLRLYDAVFVVPTVNAGIVLSGSFAAFFILREIPTFLPACIVGILTVVLGIAFLSRPGDECRRTCVDDAA